MQTFITWGRQFHPHEAGDYRNAGSNPGEFWAAAHGDENAPVAL